MTAGDEVESNWVDWERRALGVGWGVMTSE